MQSHVATLGSETSQIKLCEAYCVVVRLLLVRLASTMANTSDASSAVPSDGLDVWVADAAAARVTSAVTSCMFSAWVAAAHDTRQAQQLAVRMKVLKAIRHLLNKDIRNAARKRARLLKRARGLLAIMKVVAKRNEATSRAVAKAKAKAKAAA